MSHGPCRTTCLNHLPTGYPNTELLYSLLLRLNMVNYSPPPFTDDHSFLSLSGIPLYSESFPRNAGLDPVLSNTSQLLTGTASYKSTVEPFSVGSTPNALSANVPIDIPLAPLLLLNANMPSLASARRARSGSLFSTNSIWNDDALLLNSPSRALLNSGVLDLFPDMPSLAVLAAPGPSSGSSFISPVLSAQPSSLAMANPTRNRSHTTSNHTVAFGVKPAVDTTRMSVSPFLLAVPEPSALLDNMLPAMADIPQGQAPRNRSQTYSGVTPKLPELTLAMGSFSRPIQLLHLNNPPPAQPHFADPGNQSFDYPLAYAAKDSLQDDFNIFDLPITTSFDNPNLGPTNTLLLDNLPHFIDAAGLHKLLSNQSGVAIGHHNAGITSVRMSQRTGSKLALVDFVSIEAAMTIKANFNHLELMPGVILYVAFAKVGDDLAQKPSHALPASVNAPVPGHVANGAKLAGETSRGNRSLPKAADLHLNSPSGKSVDSLMDSVSRLSASQPIDLKKVVSMIKQAATFPNSEYQLNYGLLPEPMVQRQFDAPKLRELRKILENSEKNVLGQNASDSDTSADGETLSQVELEELCLSMLDELPEICYDHIGNTVVQKLFTIVASPVIKLIMIKEIAPYFAQLGIHKNGTWAIQKIINNSLNNCLPKVLIANSLKPYAAKLFNDQFGNYVLQCCLKFGSPFNDFIFETVYDNFLEISCGRFGARCLRAILETSSENNSTNSGLVSNEQLFLFASLIVENATELIVNNNGSLLITWFLDTFTGCKNAEYDFRYSLLTDKLMSSLDMFCSHKLASLTVYKILYNRVDFTVKQKIMNAIFGNFNELEELAVPPTEVLESILEDSAENNSGPLFIYKIVSNPSSFAIGSEALNQKYQQFCVAQVKRVLLEININNQQPYKKLIDEVGLATNKINKSLNGGRKNKRGPNNHQNHQNMNNRLGPSKGVTMPYQTQMMPQPMKFNNYHNGPNMYAPNVPYGTQAFNNGGYAFAGQYGDPMQAQREHDFSVMHDLEQLSLSSAAMGYGSNPQTPLASVSIGKEGLFF